MSFMDDLQVDPNLKSEFAMFCRDCKRETKGVKRFKPGHPRVWINLCVFCGKQYVTMPPGSRRIRQRERSYVKSSGQRSLFP